MTWGHFTPLKRPPIFYNAYIDSTIIECAYLTDKEQVYNCLKLNEVSDTLTFVDLRKNPLKYPYLYKVFDSDDYDFMNHFRIYKINYEKMI